MQKVGLHVLRQQYPSSSSLKPPAQRPLRTTFLGSRSQQLVGDSLQGEFFGVQHRRSESFKAMAILEQNRRAVEQFNARGCTSASRRSRAVDRAKARRRCERSGDEPSWAAAVPLP